MTRHERFLNIADTARRNSPMRTKVGAVLVRGSRIIKTGYNTPGKSKIIGAWSRHAEIQATINVNAEGSRLYIVRKSTCLSVPSIARPCKLCREWLQYINVNEVIYSIPDYPYYEIEEI